MKTVEELKEEQYALKAKLHEMVEFLNGEEFLNLSDKERNLITQQRVGMELYLNCLTRRVYIDSEVSDSNNLIWLSILWGMFTPSFGSGITDNKEYLNEILDKSKQETKEDHEE